MKHITMLLIFPLLACGCESPLQRAVEDARFHHKPIDAEFLRAHAGEPDIEFAVEDLVALASENKFLARWLEVHHSLFVFASKRPDEVRRGDYLNDAYFRSGYILIYDEYLRKEARRDVSRPYRSTTGYLMWGKGEKIEYISFYTGLRYRQPWPRPGSHIHEMHYISYCDLGLIPRTSTNPRAHSALAKLEEEKDWPF